jgi:DNA-directed RNA polymerase-5 subunit 1
MKTVAKGILKDHLVLVADSMVSINIKKRFNNASYKATFCPLKVQVLSYRVYLVYPYEMHEKTVERCHPNPLGCVVSSCLWGKHAVLGTNYLLRFCNENQLKSNKEYDDGLYVVLTLVRTDQEKARYTFLEDVQQPGRLPE